MAPRIIRPEISPTAPIELRHAMGDVYVTIQHKEEYIEAKWQGHITADNVVSASLAFLELLKSKRCSKLLNDKSDVTGDWQEANDWLQFEWLPRAMEAGLRFMAHVYSFNMFSQLAARELQERITPEVSMKSFYERPLAEEWLREQDDTAADRRAATA
ncbi:hypothetical protein [uncultured Pontibacter sp.]|uniref:hypothetical protein n=1 Tax=uncultured Pontibacter sp. TaxID=453356 RepID=UPI00260A1A73|nr:hypothetical protein [uncultured Pontibacter sp.]